MTISPGFGVVIVASMGISPGVEAPLADGVVTVVDRRMVQYGPPSGLPATLTGRLKRYREKLN